MRHRHYVLRNKRSGQISSRGNQGELALLMKASELIAEGDGGIPTLLVGDIAENLRDIRKVTPGHTVELVELRNRDIEDLHLREVLKALIEHYLRDKKKLPARAKSALKFTEWLRAEMRKPPREKGELPSAVHRLVDNQSPLRHMGARQIQSMYTLLRKMQS